MRLFGPLYDWTLRWANHRRAPWALSGLSFAESIVFPIPTDVMLAPMVLAQPRQWLFYTALATGFSVLGGVLGYLLGVWTFDWASSWLLVGDEAQVFAQAQQHFREWGAWFVLVAAFTPIPYKVFTISAGFMALPLAPFVVASVVGRGARYLLVAGLAYWIGSRYEPWLRRYVEPLGWAIVIVLVAVFVFSVKSADGGV